MVSSAARLLSLDACTGISQFIRKGRKIVNGRIIALKPAGFGFIISDDLTSPVFFHASALANRQFSQLVVGYPVTFTLERNEKGLRGLDVAVSEM